MHCGTLLTVDGNPAVMSMLRTLLGFCVGWPIVVLALVMRPPARRVLDHVAQARQRIFAEDGGILGAAALMAALGSVGVALTAMWSVSSLSAGVMRAGFFGVIILIIGMAFLVRSALHALTGWRTLRHFNPTRFRADCDRYFTIAVLTTVLMGLLMLFISLQAGILGFVSIVPVLALSMLWPSLVRNVGAVDLRPDLEDDPPPIRASRDNGVVTLGMVLLAMASIAGGGLWLAQARSPFNLGELSNQPPWLNVASLALTLWAGIECVGMTTRRKLATAAYLVGSIAGALYGLVRLISVMGEVPGIRSLLQQGLWVGLFSGLTALALPVVVAYQVLRKDAGDPVNVEDIF